MYRQALQEMEEEDAALAEHARTSDASDPSATIRLGDDDAGPAASPAETNVNRPTEAEQHASDAVTFVSKQSAAKLPLSVSAVYH